MFKPGDQVEVKVSKCGYTGPGTVLDLAYGQFYLVQVKRTEGNPIILVRFTCMVHDRTTRQGPDKAERDTAQEDDSYHGTSQGKTRVHLTEDQDTPAREDKFTSARYKKDQARVKRSSRGRGQG
jgi:hypothetical protein